jgi:hypothetical protein
MKSNLTENPPQSNLLILRGSILLLSMCGRYNSSDKDIQLYLVFFSPFDELRLRTAGIMESKGIHRVY